MLNRIFGDDGSFLDDEDDRDPADRIRKVEFEAVDREYTARARRGIATWADVLKVCRAIGFGRTA